MIRKESKSKLVAVRLERARNALGYDRPSDLIESREWGRSGMYYSLPDNERTYYRWKAQGVPINKMYLIARSLKIPCDLMKSENPVIENGFEDLVVGLNKDKSQLEVILKELRERYMVLESFDVHKMMSRSISAREKELDKFHRSIGIEKRPDETYIYKLRWHGNRVYTILVSSKRRMMRKAFSKPLF